MSVDPRIGQRFGDYTIERRLGRGGMSTVYFGRETTGAGRPVALKVLHADLPENIDADKRLEQEARAVSRIEHPNVVEVYGWGITPDELPYIAMEYLEGEPLSSVMALESPMSVPRLLNIALQILDVLAVAHSLEIIHRDLKPDNVFLVRREGEEDFVKVLDFGIAKLLGVQPHSLVHTVRGVVLGTPEYLSPEIAMDLKISQATDIYALGVILFEALTGRLPFTGRGPGELAEHHCFTPPPRLRAFNRELPVELERVVLRCLAKEPSQRYPDAAALAEALRPFLGVADDGHTVVSVPVGTVTAETGPALQDLDGIEHALRDEIERRSISREVPPSIERTLAEVDAVRAELEDLGTELALVRDRLGDVPELSGREGELEAVVAEDEQLALRLAETRGALTELTDRIRGRTDDAAEMLGQLVGPDASSTSSLQAILSTNFLERVASHIRVGEEEDDIRLRELVAEVERLVGARADALGRRAALESEMVVERARHAVERLRLAAERERLEGRRDAARHALASLLSQTAMDLAVAVGV